MQHILFLSLFLVCAFWKMLQCSNGVLRIDATDSSMNRLQHQGCRSRELRERLASSDSQVDKGMVSKVVLCFIRGMSMRLQGWSKEEQEHNTYF